MERSESSIVNKPSGLAIARAARNLLKATAKLSDPASEMFSKDSWS